MDAQPNNILDGLYDDATATARAVVASSYNLVLCPPDSPDYPKDPQEWREVWRVDLNGTHPVQILIGIPSAFPDELPTVYLPQHVASDASPIPHLNRHRILCTFDTNVCTPNADQPGEVVIAVVEQAAAVWTAGITGENRQDFSDELKAYWDDVSTINAYSIVPPRLEDHSIAALRLSPAWAGAELFFAKTVAHGRVWLGAVGYKGRINDSAALRLPLQSLGMPPFPVTNADLYRRLQETDPEALTRLLSFLKSNPRPSTILAQVQKETGPVSLAWIHPAASHTVMGRQGFQTVKGSIPGFRPGHLPPDLELTRLFPGRPLTRVDVTDIHREHLTTRTHGSVPSTFPFPVNIIGCGSIGSFIAEALARSGRVTDLRLIDPEKLGSENVQRHYCGMSDIGQYKTKAISRRLRQHFPSLRCSTHEIDVLELLRTAPEKLSPASLTIIALGDLAVERRLNRLLFEKGFPFHGETLFVWVEPFLIGGHAVRISNRERGCFECLFDNKMRFRHRILREPGLFSRRASGCQSSYTPYGGNAIPEFVANILRLAFSPVAPSTGNTLFTWCGDLDTARTEGIDIRQEYAKVPVFSSLSRQIKTLTSCTICTL